MSDVAASRKVVTVLFSDLVESTSLAERLDPEALARLLDSYFREMRSIVEAHGGTVEKFIGDAVVGVFGIPAVHEDDAQRAVSAALAMQEQMTHIAGGELRARIGVNTGEVVVSSVGDNLALGHAMNMAARLQQAAQPGEVLIGARTQALIVGSFELEDAGQLDVKGSDEPISAARVIGSRELAPRGWSGASTFVGREREVAHILDGIDEAKQAQTCVTVMVLAPPGMGKSRLAAEVGRSVGDSVTFLVGRCLPYGEGITYSALADVVRGLTADSGSVAVREIMAGESDADLVISVIELTAAGASQSSPDETAWAFRRLLEIMAAQKPVVLVLDDLHWADPLFLDLVEYLSTFSVGAPLTVIGLARPDLLDSRPSMLTPRAHSMLIRLEPLAAHEMAKLLASSELIDDAARQRIAETSGGVPLFAEQMAASEQEGIHDVPPSVRALLAARVDRLEPIDRQLLEIASVEGEVFNRSTISGLSADDVATQIGGRLISLVQRDFIRPERSVAGRDAFRFSHALVRDAVYEQMSRSVRSDLHERYASVLAADHDGGSRLDVIGHHLATAHAEALALGDTAGARGLALRAAAALGEAGDRAIARKEWRRGADLLNRASELLADDPRARIRMTPELLKAYDGLGQRDARDALRDSALLEARDMSDRATELRIEMALAISSFSTMPPTPEFQERVGHLSATATEYFESHADHWNLADAWILKAMSIGHGDPGGQAEAYLKAQSYANLSGNESAQIVIWDELGYVLLIGDTPFSKVRDHMQREIDWADERGIAFTAADGLLGAAYCLHAANELAQARSTLGQLREIFASLPGDVSQHGESYVLSGAVEVDAGDTPAAIPYYEKARDLFAAIDARGWWHGTTVELTHAYLDVGQLDTADRVLAELDYSPLAGAPRTRSYELSARARLASGRGDHGEALTLIGEALERSLSGVNPRNQARILEDAAKINEAANNAAESRRSLERALELYTAKEYEVGRVRVEARLRALG